MPTDHNILFGLKSFQDYADVERQRALQERQIGMQEQIAQAQLAKSMRPDLKSVAEQVFYKAAMGQQLSAEEQGLARAYDISKQQVYTDAFGNTVSRPSVLDRMGTFGGMMAPPSATPGYAPPEANRFGNLVQPDNQMAGVMPPQIDASNLPSLPPAGGMGGFDPNVPPNQAPKPTPAWISDPIIAQTPWGRKAVAESDLKRQDAVVTATATQDAKAGAAEKVSLQNSNVALGAFEESKKVSLEAPSGWAAEAGAKLYNKTNNPNKTSIGLGKFNVQRASTENAIRRAYKIAGAGAQTDSDAKPIIDMLPLPDDPAEVKTAKIDQAMRAMETDIRSRYGGGSNQSSGAIDYKDFFNASP